MPRPKSRIQQLDECACAAANLLVAMANKYNVPTDVFGPVALTMMMTTGRIEQATAYMIESRQRITGEVS